jgi:diphthine-ammonia ligase
MQRHPTSCALSFSGGKDSMLALDRAIRRGWPVTYLLNLYDEASERVRFHGVHTTLIQAQADALGMPLLSKPTRPDTFEQVFLQALDDLSRRGVDAIIFGNIHLADVRAWYEERTTGHDLLHLEPLWGEPVETLAREVIQRGYHAVLTSVELARAKESWLGQPLSEPLLAEFAAAGIDICGERGEYHTFVSNGPLFCSPVPIRLGEQVSMPGYALIDLLLDQSLPSPVPPAQAGHSS